MCAWMVLGMRLGMLWGILGLLGIAPNQGCTVDVERRVRGSGGLTRETREVPEFASVAFLTSGHLDIEVAESEVLLIEAEDNLLGWIETEVVDDQLVIRHRGNVALAPSKPLRFHLKVRELDAIAFAGDGSVRIPRLETDRLEIRHSGSGRIEAGLLQTDILAIHSSGSGPVSCERVSARRCRLIASGSGNVEIEHLEGLANIVRLTGAGGIAISNGSVVEQDIFVSGSGDLDARGLRSTLSEVMVSGCGNAAVHAEKTLDATITGSGDIQYRGRPQLHRRVTGSGELRQI